VLGRPNPKSETIRDYNLNDVNQKGPNL